MSGSLLTPAWFPLRYHALQSQLWRTEKRFLAVAAGRGSGKTELSRRRIVRFLSVRKPWKDPLYFFALPTREQAKRVAWDKICSLIPDNWIVPNGKLKSELSIRTVFGSTFFLVGMDKPQRIEGNQWDGGVIDESCDQHPGSFERSVRPALSHRSAWCWRIGVPKRFGPGAGNFKRFWTDADCGALGTDHGAFNWPSDEILTPDELESARRSLDPRDFEEQYGAIWQDVSGLCFYAFKEEEPGNVDAERAVYKRNEPLVIGSDFNVDPMAWTIGHFGGTNGRGVITVFDELWKRNTNTPACLDALFAKYGSHEAGFYFFGDATARSRNTRATETDYAHIANDKRFRGSRVRYPKSNPPVVDRLSSCNRAFCNAASERSLFIHPRCTHLIADLSSRSFKQGTRDPDDTDPDAGHITDALGYVIHYLRPVSIISDVQPAVHSSEDAAALVA